MKSEAEIRTRLQELFLREFDRRVGESRTRLPWLCTHNHQQPLDNRKMVEGERNDSYNRITTPRRLPVARTIGLCMLGAQSPEEWPGDICDEPIDAMKCPYFTPKRSKNDILSEFADQVNDPAWVEAHMPEAHGLIWALEGFGATTLPWWKRAWFWLTSVEPAPPVVRPALAALLPEAGRDDAGVGP